MSTTYDQGHALIIGVGSDLPNTVNDARGFAGILRDPKRCGYHPKQIHLLTGEMATRQQILGALEQLAAASLTEATVVVYFSGHGYRVQTSIGAAYYLMPYGYDVNRLYQTAISGAELAVKLHAIPAGKLLLILDCCHAGGLENVKLPGLEVEKAPLPPEAEALFASGSGRVVIASSQADEYSYAGKPYSAFTLALIEAFAGVGNAKKDGYVRVADLALHTREMVPQRTNNKQHPVLHFEQADNFVLAYYAAGEKEPKGLPFTQKPEIEVEPGQFNKQQVAYRAHVEGGGAIAQGAGATAVGERGVNVGGSVGGSVITGDVNTSGGDFVGRDKLVHHKTLQENEKLHTRGSLVRRLRLDAAVPDKSYLDQEFVLAVALRFPSSPQLKERDLALMRSGEVQVTWPASETYIQIRVQVSAPSCEIIGEWSKLTRLYNFQEPPTLYFHLVPKRMGEISIIITVYQQEELSGSARVHTIVEQVVGKMDLQIVSRELDSSKESLSATSFAELRINIQYYFNGEELNNLCYDLGISHEFISGNDHSGRVRELIFYCQRHGLLTDLLEHCNKLRPFVTWQK